MVDHDFIVYIVQQFCFIMCSHTCDHALPYKVVTIWSWLLLRSYIVPVQLPQLCYEWPWSQPLSSSPAILVEALSG